MSELTVQTGRPADLSGRAARECRTYDLLDRLGVAYTRVDHEPAMTMEDCVAIDRAMGVNMCKNLFLCNRQQTDFYLLLMPGDKPFRTKELSSQIGTARLSFASAEHMLEKLDILPGAVSVMGLMNDREHAVQLLIDEDLLTQDRFGAHPCVNTSSLCFATDDLLRVILPALGYAYRTVSLGREET